MLPINNSDTAWLIVSDYNQDNAIGYPDCLREDIDSPNINEWNFESYGITVGGRMGEWVGDDVNHCSHVGSNVGSNICNTVGTEPYAYNEVGSSSPIGEYVGGTYAADQ